MRLIYGKSESAFLLGHHVYFLGQNMFNHTYLGPESLPEFYWHWTGNTNTKDLETKVSVEDYDNAVWLL